MNYHNIKHDDMLNGDGLRVTLFVSGCIHCCPNCQNPQTWDVNSGITFDSDAVCEILDALKKDHISGITLSGGDPLYTPNKKTIGILCQLIKDMFPQKTIWLYSGYLWEDVVGDEILEHIDVFIDGEYEEANRDVKLHWVGSSNQRVIDVKKSLEQGTVVLYE